MYTLEVKKSKFIANIYNVNSEQEVKDILMNLRKEHRKAKHIVYAYTLNIEGQTITKFSDDKEPSRNSRKTNYVLATAKRITECSNSCY